MWEWDNDNRFYFWRLVEDLAASDVYGQSTEEVENEIAGKLAEFLGTAIPEDGTPPEGF